jgi:fission process protein 1
MAGVTDVWRDSLVRYLGYANEVGESFRPVAPRLVLPSYVVAFGYVAGDTLDKAVKAHRRATDEGVPARKRAVAVANATVDTLLWQTSVDYLSFVWGRARRVILSECWGCAWRGLQASVVIPGFTINRVVRKPCAACDR